MPKLTKLKPKLSRNGWFAVAGFTIAAALMILILALLPEAESAPPKPAAPTIRATEPAIPRNPLSAADFAYQGGYLTCLTYPSQLGIDISSYVTDVDWAQVKASGVEFVILRLGYRGNEAGGLFADELFPQHYAGAKAAGLKIGAYFYSQATSEAEALEEADFAMALLDGRSLDMPLVYDWEYSGPGTRVDNVDRDTLTAATVAFCRQVEQAGFDPMIYFNPDQARNLLHLDQLTDYPFWLAMYSDEMTFDYQVDMWQYTCTGSVSGIDQAVDINLFFPEY